MKIKVLLSPIMVIVTLLIVIAFAFEWQRRKQNHDVIMQKAQHVNDASLRQSLPEKKRIPMASTIDTVVQWGITLFSKIFCN